MLEEQTFNPKVHDRQSFTSGIEALDEYLKRFAAQQSKKGIATIQVLVDSQAPHAILGYYGLSAAQIDIFQLDEHAQKKLPRYPIPCFRMGRLAVHTDYQGRGLGRLLIGCAVERCLRAREHIAAYALLVEAKDEKAKTFYEHYGFSTCKDHLMTLYLPLGQMIRA